MIAAEILDFSGDVGGMIIFAKTKRTKSLARSLAPAMPDDPEASPVKSDDSPWQELAARPPAAQNEITEEKRHPVDPSVKPILLEDRPIFTFKDVSYSIGDKTLLRLASGWVRPGQLTALMGVSGAGKTTYVLILFLSARIVL